MSLSRLASVWPSTKRFGVYLALASLLAFEQNVACGGRRGPAGSAGDAGDQAGARGGSVDDTDGSPDAARADGGVEAGASGGSAGFGGLGGAGGGGFGGIGGQGGVGGKGGTGGVGGAGGGEDDSGGASCVPARDAGPALDLDAAPPGTFACYRSVLCLSGSEYCAYATFNGGVTAGPTCRPLPSGCSSCECLKANALSCVFTRVRQTCQMWAQLLCYDGTTFPATPGPTVHCNVP